MTDAHVVALHVWPAGAGTPVPVDVLALDWGGPVGDRHHGETMLSDARQRKVFDDGTAIRNHRQVSIIDTSGLAAIAVALGVPSLDPGVIADNICTEGIPGLTSLPRMTRMVFGSGAVIMLGGENHPCTVAGGLVQSVHGTPAHSFPKAAMGLRGVTGWVERPGALSAGDSVELVLP
ncbi:MAG: MOSC domain-containing protein [Candidatus Nanopelagicales bacterium]